MTNSEKERLYKLIGENVSRYIKEFRGLTQTEFAEKILMNRSTLSNIIAGRQQISIHLLFDIAKELKVEPSALLPSIDSMQSAIEEDKIQYNKIFTEKGLSEKTQATILNLLDKQKKD